MHTMTKRFLTKATAIIFLLAILVILGIAGYNAVVG